MNEDIEVSGERDIKEDKAGKEHKHRGFGTPKINTNDLKRGIESRARMYLTGNQNFTDDTLAKVNLNTESFDELGELDLTSNYRFTALKEGYYLVIGNVTWALGGTEDRFMGHIYKNGSSISYSSAISSNSQEPSNHMSDIVYLEPGDYLELYAEQESGDTIAALAGSNYTYLAITKLFPK